MVTVRPATLADAPEIAAVHVETWRAAYTGLIAEDVIAGFDIETRKRLWSEALSREPRPGSAVFVAEADGTVVGFVAVGAGDDAGELYAIYVTPGHWGTGAGRALIARGEESLRESGFAEARLWVLDGNERAERFYRSAGWAPGERRTEVIREAEIPERRYSKRL